MKITNKKAKLNYVMWLGPKNHEPRVRLGCNYWWETPENGKNI